MLIRICIRLFIHVNICLCVSVCIYICVYELTHVDVCLWMCVSVYKSTSDRMTRLVLKVPTFPMGALARVGTVTMPALQVKAWGATTTQKAPSA